jgi:hypothetical protein
MKGALLLLLVVASLGTAFAADVTGDWEMELDPDFSGNKDVIGCSLKQDGEKLTANCGAGPNILGEVRGQAVTFRVKTGVRDQVTATFTGTLDQRATTIAGTWTLADENGKREGRFTLRKR